MEEKQTPPNREILVAVTKLNSHFEDDGIIPAIKKQVEKTNGRVTKLEQWRWLVVGGFVALSMVVGIPKVIDMLFPDKVEASETQLRGLITEILNTELDKEITQ